MISRTGTALGRYTVCTSSTHPSSPSVGDSLFETDTGKFLQWQSATTGWTPPWNSDFGFQQLGTATANQTGFSAITDLTGLSAAFTAIGNRRYKVEVNVVLGSTVLGDQLTLTLANGAGTALQAWPINEPGASFAVLASPTFVVLGLAAGAQTLKLRLARTGGTGTCILAASATSVASISVTDDGPNGNPL